MAIKLDDPEEIFAQLREKYEAQRKEARASLDEAEGWLRGLDALDRERRSKQPSLPLEGKPRAVRGKRQEVLDLFKQHPDGLLARQVAEKLGVSDKKQQSAVNAALHNLKKQGFLTQEGRGGQYVTAETHAEATTPSDESAA